MSVEMKKRAMKASSATRSTNIVSQITRADVVVLNRTMEPIIRQNKRERIASEEAMAKLTVR